VDDNTIASDPDASSAGENGRSSGSVIALALIVATAVIVAGGLIGLGFGMRAGPASMDLGMPMASGTDGFTLANVPAHVAEHYRAAREAGDPYQAVPCFCGCEATLGHRNLYECFVTRDGAWEPHAAGCAVCIDESARIQRMRERGLPHDVMRERIVNVFGGLAGVD
jgi:hypothetical protein